MQGNELALEAVLYGHHRVVYEIVRYNTVHAISLASGPSC